MEGEGKGGEVPPIGESGSASDDDDDNELVEIKTSTDGGNTKAAAVHKHSACVSRPSYISPIAARHAETVIHPCKLFLDICWPDAVTHGELRR